MHVDVYSDKLTKLSADLLVVTCFKDRRPLRGLAGEVDWYYGGILSRALMDKRFDGTLGEMLLLSTAGKLSIPKVILMGLGESSKYGYAQFKTVSIKLHAALKGLDLQECAVEIDTASTQKLNALKLVEAFRLGEDRSLRKDPLGITFVVKENEKAGLMQKYFHKRISA